MFHLKTATSIGTGSGFLWLRKICKDLDGKLDSLTIFCGFGETVILLWN